MATIKADARAQRILQSLVAGIHPITGRELPGDSVLQHADVLRALTAGLNALEQRNARVNRRAENAGRAWSAEEEATLINSYKRGDALTEIAEKHGRSLRGIEARLERLGLMTAEQRATEDAWAPTKS